MQIKEGTFSQSAAKIPPRREIRGSGINESENARLQTDDFSEVNLSSSIDEKNMIKFSCKIREDCCTSDSRLEKTEPPQKKG